MRSEIETLRDARDRVEQRWVCCPGFEVAFANRHGMCRAGLMAMQMLDTLIVEAGRREVSS